MIKLQNVAKHYIISKQRSVMALNNINLRIEAGEFAAIMGPSGSGKSTLMHILGCLDQLSAGEYFLNGQKVSTLNTKELAKIRNQLIGFVFQDYSLLPRRNIIDNITLPLVYRGEPQPERHKKAELLLEKLGLHKYALNKPTQLSGGEQQRVAIARAMITMPKIILADEPTGNLDSKTSATIMELLTELNQKQKITIIIVTHDDHVAGYSNRLIKLMDGEIISDEKSVLKK
jgi:putative ABC transport system ATP-binding protein